MSYGKRQYDSLTPDDKRSRDNKVLFVWVAFVVLLLSIIFLWVWLANGNRPHHLTPLTIILVILTIIFYIAWNFAAHVPVKSNAEELVLDIMEYIFGIALVGGLLVLVSVLLTRAFTGGS